MTWATMALATAAWLGLVPLGVRATILMIKRRQKRQNQEWLGAVVPAVLFSVMAVTMLQAIGSHVTKSTPGRNLRPFTIQSEHTSRTHCIAPQWPMLPLRAAIPAWHPLWPGWMCRGRSASVILTSPTLRAAEVRIPPAPHRTKR